MGVINCFVLLVFGSIQSSCPRTATRFRLAAAAACKIARRFRLWAMAAAKRLRRWRPPKFQRRSTAACKIEGPWDRVAAGPLDDAEPPTINPSTIPKPTDKKPVSGAKSSGAPGGLGKESATRPPGATSRPPTCQTLTWSMESEGGPEGRFWAAFRPNLVPEPLYRRGSFCSSGWTKNHVGRPILKPFRIVSGLGVSGWRCRA